jgi:hypothetical protein
MTVRMGVNNVLRREKMSWRLGGDVSEEEENDVMKGSIWFD